MAYSRRVPFTHPMDDFPSQHWPAVRRPEHWEGFSNRPSRAAFFDRSFGDALRDDEFFSGQSVVPHRGYYVTPPSDSAFDRMPRGGMGDMQLSSTEFKVAIDAKNFKPEELDVKIADDEVIVHGKHEEKSDSQGSVSREFTRRYKLPADVDPADVTSSLSEEGVLCIRGPRKGSKPAATSIPISIQGKPAVEQTKK